jgi:hypothetical protein
MESIKKKWRFMPLTQREAAEKYMLLTLLSFAASVTFTRLFLSMTGYPQIGGGELHIAHVLWGGLLLYVAALLPLMFVSREIYTVTAILAGIGVGLFIDEVGKFITQRNDYFYPIAASIIYILFLLTILAFLNIRRSAQVPSRDALTRAFEDICESLHRPLTNGEYLHLKASLDAAARTASSQRHAELVNTLSKFLEADAASLPVPQDRPQSTSGPLGRIMACVFSDRFLRVYLILGLLVIGLLTLKNPLGVGLAPWMPHTLSMLLSINMGRHLEPATAPLLSSIRMSVEVIVGFLLLTSAGLLTARKNRLGTAVGTMGLFLSLTTMNILLFYFEQFSTIITAAVQFLLIVGILVYRRHTVPLKQ